MYAVEFRASVKDGKIEIPERYRDKLKERVRVIILTEVNKETNNLIDQLLASPLRIKDFRPLSRDDIYTRT